MTHHLTPKITENDRFKLSMSAASDPHCINLCKTILTLSKLYVYWAVYHCDS